MKKFLFVFLVFGIFACKEEEVAPVLSEVVQGDYTITIVKVSGLPLAVPFTNPLDGSTLTATATVTKKTETSVTAKITTTSKDKAGKVTTTPIDLGEFTLSGDGKTSVDISQNGSKLGSYMVATKTLMVNTTIVSPLDNKPTAAEITATKN